MPEQKATGAFFGSEELKRYFVAQMQEHRRLDDFRQGYYWQNGSQFDSDSGELVGSGKGCAVGCIVGHDVHAFNVGFNVHETAGLKLNMPEELMILVDNMFEGMANHRDAGVWAVGFLEAVPVGATFTDRTVDELRMKLDKYELRDKVSAAPDREEALGIVRETVHSALKDIGAVPRKAETLREMMAREKTEALAAENAKRTTRDVLAEIRTSYAPEHALAGAEASTD